MAGTGLGLAGYLVLLAFGLPRSGTAGLVFVQFLGLFLGGYVAGRLGGVRPVLDGGLAALVVYGVAMLLTIAGGASPGVVPLVSLGIVSAVLGSAGGVLAQGRGST